MADHKSALKKIRQDEKRHARNKTIRTRYRNLIKAVRIALDAGDGAQAKEALAKATPYLQKVTTKGILHKNTAARYISRLTKRVQAIQG